MGIFERPPGSKIWWADYRQNGVRYRKKVGKKSLAEEYLVKMREKARLAELFPEKARAAAANITVAQLCERYRDEDKNTNSNHSHHARYERYWCEAIGEKFLHQVTSADVERYRSRRLEAGLENSTINKEVSRLRRLFNLAIRDELLERNPLARIKKLPEDPGRVRYLQDGPPPEDEEQRLELAMHELTRRTSFRCAVKRPFDLVEVAFRTGLRQEEQFSLQRQNLDFRAEVIIVYRTKTRKERSIPMHPRVKELLEAQLARVPSTCPWVWPSRVRKNHIDPHNFYTRQFVPALDLAGIEEFVWHDLRHTFGSRLAMAGHNEVTIAELMGHTSIATTRRYMHLSPGHKRQAVLSLR